MHKYFNIKENEGTTVVINFCRKAASHAKLWCIPLKRTEILIFYKGFLFYYLLCFF